MAVPTRRGLMGMAAAGLGAAALGWREPVAGNGAGVPFGACDAHIHVIDPRFPASEGGGTAEPHATLSDYLRVQKRLGTDRTVVVQPKHFGTDNTCIVDAVRRLGDGGRGIAVAHPTITDGELRRLSDAGVRGLRFSVWNPADTVTTIDMIEPLARRIADLGWHVQLHMSGDQVAEHAALLRRLPVPIVFDHMARLPPEQGTAHPAYRVVRELLDRGRTWVKLSGPYLNTVEGPPDYPDAARVARAYVAAAPERLVWGSDWPHTTEKDPKPDDRALLALLNDWAPDPRVRRRILVGNPAELYAFG